MSDDVKPTENKETQYAESGGAPSRECENITPNDATELVPWARSLWVGVSGDVTIETPRGVSVLFTAVAAGTILPTWASKVLDTGTDASNIVAFYG